jgi:hypothetical protein
VSGPLRPGIESDVVQVGVTATVDNDFVPRLFGNGVEIGVGDQRAVRLGAQQLPLAG